MPKIEKPWTKFDRVVSPVAVLSLLAFGLAFTLPTLSVAAGAGLDALDAAIPEDYNVIPSNKELGLFMSPETFSMLVHNKYAMGTVATLGGIGSLAHMIMIARGKH